jgi:hypothetical protein
MMRKCNNLAMKEGRYFISLSLSLSLSHKATKKTLALSILNFFLDITRTMKALKHLIFFSLTRWGMKIRIS